LEFSLAWTAEGTTVSAVQEYSTINNFTCFCTFVSKVFIFNMMFLFLLDCL
jgi:hypothetical protein